MIAAEVEFNFWVAIEKMDTNKGLHTSSGLGKVLGLAQLQQVLAGLGAILGVQVDGERPHRRLEDDGGADAAHHRAMAGSQVQVRHRRVSSHLERRRHTRKSTMKAKWRALTKSILRMCKHFT